MSESKHRSLWTIRVGLIVTGGGLLAVGVLCMAAPYWIAVPLEWMIGGAVFFAGMAGAFHLLASLIGALGMRHKRSEVQTDSVEPSLLAGSSANIAQRRPLWMVVGMQLLLGATMLLWPEMLRPYWLVVLPLAITVEGVLILWASLHFSSLTSKAGMWVSGLLSIAVAILALSNWSDANSGHWLGALLGFKFLLLGLIFVQIGLRATASDLQLAYVAEKGHQDAPQTGSIYAVYYGPAFHCGISVGDGKIVDYLTDGVVRFISWEEFLLGRRALEWNYPDVSAGDPESIAVFARSLVGKYNKYDALRFNCENLAIFCRSVGQTTHSAFSQASVGVEFVKQRPILGSMVQLLNRGASWFLYGAGGPFGKKIGFAMIRIARILTDWVVARPMRQNEAFSKPTEVYMPDFQDREASQSSANHQES